MTKNKKRKSILIPWIALILMVTLVACTPNFNKDSKDSKEITTYEENIEDGKVEIDGISYDVQYISKVSHTYDDNRNLIKTAYEKDGSEIRSEFLYENNQLIEEKSYSNDKLSYTITYYYENNLLAEQRFVYDSGLEVRTEYSYRDNNKTKIATHYNSDDSIGLIATEYLDDDGRMLKGVFSTEDGEITDTTTMYYENDLLVKSIREKADGAVNTYNTEYNNLGDKIIISNFSIVIFPFYSISIGQDCKVIGLKI